MELDVKKFKLTLARRIMSIKELSEKSGITTSTINSWIKSGTGKRNPQTKTLGKIARALEVDITELIKD